MTGGLTGACLTVFRRCVSVAVSPDALVAVSMTSWVPFLHGSVIRSLPLAARSAPTCAPSRDSAVLCAPAVSQDTLTGTSPLAQCTADFMDSDVITGAGGGEADGDDSPEPEPDEQADTATTQAATTIRGARMRRA